MISAIDKFLDEYGLKTQNNTLLVGFSGGYDSMCLLDILNTLSVKYGFRLIALHLNHNWRGAESKQEELNSKKYCESIGVEFISEMLEETAIKTESFARESRYNFFIKHARNYPNSVILTAHTLSDNAETIIYRLIKGTGIKGLQGILPKRMVEEIPLYRPLLGFSRMQIEDYCNSKGLVANNDSSNLDIRYKRNFIRHKIMPLFKEINFNAENSIDSLTKLAISQNNILSEYMELMKKEILEDKKILTEKFKHLSKDVRQQIVYDLFISEKLDYDNKKITNVLEFITNNFESKSGSRYSLTDGLWLFVNSKYIYSITKTHAGVNKSEINISKEGDYEITWEDSIFSITDNVPLNFQFPPESEKSAYITLDEVGIDLTIRTRRDGDFISPLGMQGTMKLKKYLNSKGVSQHEKDKLILLAKGSEVLWVAGVGLSNKIKVVNKPTHVIRLQNKI